MHFMLDYRCTGPFRPVGIISLPNSDGFYTLMDVLDPFTPRGTCDSSLFPYLLYSYTNMPI